ncbi:MAG: sulfatase-like hydrolase/transferase [Vicinamibacterales bacterium]|jgi:arylsulfatase A-like enzyme/Flp pilus assembly protein TadD|nr:sulfatase-like hydrolase/transferase [Vicinamibacterales bacterium]
MRRGKRGVVVPAATVVAAACVAAFVFYATTRRPAIQAEPGPSPPPIRTVVLITIDTLRADRVGAYGWAAARTPAMDALAARGARFTRAFATAPITLPSHASLLTGLYPPGHGSRHNGMRVSGGPATLATVLREQGWATGAFVGAFPLDRRFGLDRGFERYSDRMPRGADGRLLNERPGRAVVDEALAWIGGIGDQPALLWVHLFEPHAPYEPDPARGPDGRVVPALVRYDDEVARADHETGRLLAGLGERAAAALVIVAGDHGEAFGEHGEIAHSVFLYDTTLRVPLIVAGPGFGAGAPDADVSLVDVLPTVVAALGLPPRDVDGVSLLPLVNGHTLPPRDLYAETFAPLFDFGWSSLRSVRSGPWKYIAAPGPELYNVAADVAESENTILRDGPRARDLAARVAKYSGPEPTAEAGPAAPVDAESRGRLGALGYVASSPSGVPGSRPDPKDRRELAARMAQVVTGELEGAALRAALEAIVAEDPRNGQAQMRLGYALLDNGDLRRAEQHFRAALAVSMRTADVHLGLAMCFVSAGRPGEAASALMEARRIEPGNPVVEANLGSLALDAGDMAKAVELLGAALLIDPDLHQARFNLARALARQGRRGEALKEAETLLQRLPSQAPQRAEVQRLVDALR